MQPSPDEALTVRRRNRVTDSASFLFSAWRVRPRARRVLWTLSILMALTGSGMLAYPYATNLFANQRQSELARQFQSPEFRVQFGSREIQPGNPVTRVVIAKLGVDALVVEGTDLAALRAGAGHYSATPLPCEKGNVAIAGHRTTYGGPFNRVDELVAGDEIRLVTPEKSCTYRVVDGPSGTSRPRRSSAGWITHPNDGGVIGPLSGSWLTLTTCHPKRSAAKRLILRGVLVG